MKIGLIKRLSKAYCTVGRTFNIWIVTIFVGIYLLTIRTINFIFMKFDWLLYPLKLQKEIEDLKSEASSPDAQDKVLEAEDELEVGEPSSEAR